MSETTAAVRVIIAGGRHYDDYETLADYADRVLAPLAPRIVILSGGALGADALGERYARERGYPLTVYPADWDRYGKAAGPIRNREMAAHADVLLCFWDMRSPGSRSMIEEARKAGLAVYVKKTAGEGEDDA